MPNGEKDMKTIQTLFPLSEEERLFLEQKNGINHAGVSTADSNIIRVPKGQTDSHAFEACFHYQVTEEGAEINGFDLTACAEQPEQKISHLVIPAQFNHYPVISIGEHAFETIADQPVSVSIPSSVRNIHPKAFSHCIHLEAFRVDENNSCFCAEEGVLFSKDKKELCCYPKAGIRNAYQIPDCVEHIGSYAFAYAQSPDTVSVPQNVVSIGSHAFYHSALKEIFLSDSVQKIGKYAFCSTQLTAISLPPQLTELSKGLFKYCSVLKKVTVPDTVTVIQECAFQKCSRLAMIVLPAHLHTIGSYAFEGCRSLISIDIPLHTVQIGDYAFMNCLRLFRITCPACATGKGAFENCPADIITATEDFNS